jgi:hypothetical protein
MREFDFEYHVSASLIQPIMNRLTAILMTASACLFGLALLDSKDNVVWRIGAWSFLASPFVAGFFCQVAEKILLKHEGLRLRYDVQPDVIEPKKPLAPLAEAVTDLTPDEENEDFDIHKWCARRGLRHP